MKKFAGLLVVSAILLFLNGCVLTKILYVPMSVCGAAISIIPVAGNTAHDAIDEAAEAVDEIPI